MKPARNEAEILSDLDKTALEIAQTTLYLEGSLQKSAKRYVKKDGSVSFYPTRPILQYRLGPKLRKSKRIPLDKVAEIERLLKDGDRFKALMARYGALASKLALDVKKKS